MNESRTGIREAFLKQAEGCAGLGSPFTARLCRLAAERLTAETAVGTRILLWPGNVTATGDAVPLRLAGALHALTLMGASPDLVAVYPPNDADDDALWSAVEAAIVEHEAFILERLQSAPQTNEVRRSAALLPGFMTIAQLTGKPLLLSEVGASAGLNLNWDRFAYTLGTAHWGGASTVNLSPDWQGPLPPLTDVTIAGRAACDLNPMDPGHPEDRLRLLSYIWPDQLDRLERTRNALEIAVRHGVKVERFDAIDWLRKRLNELHRGAVHVIYHTIAWQYLPDELKAAGEDLITAAGARATADAPLARLQLEVDDKPDGAALSLQLWPTGERHELARADFHGRRIKWKGWPST